MMYIEYLSIQSLFAFILLTKLQSIHITQPCHYYNLSLPTPLEAHQITYFENINTVYIFGGYSYNGSAHIASYTYSSAVYKWNRSHENSWFDLLNDTKIPSSMFYASTNNAVVIGNKAYFIGIHDGLYNGNIYIFDPLTDEFLDTTNLSKPLYPTWSGCVTTNKTHIFMVGGKNDNHLQIYDINTNVWTSENITISPIDSLDTYYQQFCEMIDNLLFVFGGMGDSRSGFVNINDYFVYESNKQTWTRLGSKGGSTTAGSITHYNSDILIIGGFDILHHVLSSNILTFNVNNGQFGDTFNITDAVAFFPSLILDHELYTFGGMNQAGDTVSSVQVCGLRSPSTSNNSYVYIIVSCAIGIFLLCVVLTCIMFKRRRNDQANRSMSSLLQIHAK